MNDADISVFSLFYEHVKQFKFLLVQLLRCLTFGWKIPMSSEKRMLIAAGEPAMTELLPSGDGVFLRFGLNAALFLYRLCGVERGEHYVTRC